VGIINHVVVIVKENHTFDNYFGQFPGANGSPQVNGVFQCPDGKGGVQACQRAPDKIGHDLSHAHDAALADWDNGKMDGWSTAAGSDNQGGGIGDGMAYRQYNGEQIPNYWSLAKSFVLADNFYANMLGPSFPGHLFTVAAQAGWAVANPPVDITANPAKLLGSPAFRESPYWGCDEYGGGSWKVLGFTVASYAGDTVDVLPGGMGSGAAPVFPCFNIKAIPDVLPAPITWRFYGTDWSEIGNADLSGATFASGISGAVDAAIAAAISSGLGAVPLVHEPWSMLDAVQHIRCATNCQDGQSGPLWTSNVAVTGAPWDMNNPVQRDLDSGTLANVTWIVDQDEYSEHPDLDLNMFASVFNFPLGGVCDGENWTAGYVNMIMNSPYWKDTAILITWDDFGGFYDHVPPPRQYGGDAAHPYGLGFRLPLLIISPYARPGFIFHEQAEQASIAAFIEAVFGSTMTLSDFDPAAQDGPKRLGGDGVTGANNLLHAFDFNQKPLAPLNLPMRDCSNVQ
jgi:hypothetical protein